MLVNPMCTENYGEVQKMTRKKVEALESLDRLATDLESAPQRIAIPDNSGIMVELVGPDSYISEQIRLALKELTR